MLKNKRFEHNQSTTRDFFFQETLFAQDSSMWVCSRFATVGRSSVHCISTRMTARYPAYRVATTNFPKTTSTRKDFHSSVIRMASKPTSEMVANMLEEGANLVIEENWEAAQAILEKAYKNVCI